MIRAGDSNGCGDQHAKSGNTAGDSATCTNQHAKSGNTAGLSQHCSFEEEASRHAGSQARRGATADAAVQSMFKASSLQTEGLVQRCPSLHSSKASLPLQCITTFVNPAFYIPTTVSATSNLSSLQQTTDLTPGHHSALRVNPNAQRTLNQSSTVAGVGKVVGIQHAAGAAASMSGKQGLEENLWAGIGGFGRNGRSRNAASTAALQTPRPLVPTNR